MENGQSCQGIKQSFWGGVYEVWLTLGDLIVHYDVHYVIYQGFYYVFACFAQVFTLLVSFQWRWFLWKDDLNVTIMLHYEFSNLFVFKYTGFSSIFQISRLLIWSLTKTLFITGMGMEFLLGCRFVWRNFWWNVLT